MPSDSTTVVSSERAAVLQRLRHGRLVGVDQFASHRDADSDASHANALRLQQVRQPGGGRLPVVGGIRGHDHFFEVAVADPLEQAGQAALFLGSP